MGVPFVGPGFLPFTGIGPLLGLVNRGGRPPVETPEEALKSERRRAIYALVRRRPGISISALREELDMAPSPVEQHVGILERVGLIERRRAGRFVRLYAAGSAPEEDDPALTPGSARRVALLILKKPLSAAEVAEALSLGIATTRPILRELERTGLIASEREDRPYRYVPTERLKEAAKAWRRQD